MLCKVCLGEVGLPTGHIEESPGLTLDVEINPQASGPAFRQAEEHCAFRTHSKQQVQGTRLGTPCPQHHHSSGEQLAIYC